MFLYWYFITRAKINEIIWEFRILQTWEGEEVKINIETFQRVKMNFPGPIVRWESKKLIAKKHININSKYLSLLDHYWLQVQDLVSEAFKQSVEKEKFFNLIKDHSKISPDIYKVSKQIFQKISKIENNGFNFTDIDSNEFEKFNLTFEEWQNSEETEKISDFIPLNILKIEEDEEKEEYFINSFISLN